MKGDGEMLENLEIRIEDIEDDVSRLKVTVFYR
jgi:hypothetical protein